jgi:glucose/arabinose dehydrogenase
MVIARSFASAVGCSIATLLLATLTAPLAFAQREVPFRMGIPVAPGGLADKPLGPGPFDYATGEGQNIRVTVLTKSLSFPFTLTFLPDGTLLITQRDGKLRVMRDGVLDPNPVAGGPVSFSTGTSGLPGALLEIASLPKFAANIKISPPVWLPNSSLTELFRVLGAGWAIAAVTVICTTL